MGKPASRRQTMRAANAAGSAGARRGGVKKPGPATPTAAPAPLQHWPRLDTVRPERLALEVWATGLQAAWLVAESHSVISHRLLGISGLAPRAADEMQRMVLEKGTAFSASAVAGMMLALSGRRPDEVLRAMLHPLRSTTGRNLRRLERLRAEQSGKRRAARARLTAGLFRRSTAA